MSAPALASAESQKLPGPLGYQRFDVYLSGGIAESDLGPINQAVVEHGYQPFDPRRTEVGAGVSVGWPDLRIAFDASLGLPSAKSAGPRGQAAFATASAGLSTGPDFVLGSVRIAPLAGVVFGYSTIAFPSGAAPLLVDQMSPSTAAVTRDWMELGASLAIDYRLLRHPWPSEPRSRRKTTSALLVGLRFGYCWQVHASSWYVGERRLGGGPELDQSGAVLRVIAGWQVETTPQPSLTP